MEILNKWLVENGFEITLEHGNYMKFKKEDREYTLQPYWEDMERTEFKYYELLTTKYIPKYDCFGYENVGLGYKEPINCIEDLNNNEFYTMLGGI